jgi:hypothetical protein
MLASQATPWPCTAIDQFLQVATMFTYKFNAQVNARFSVGVAYVNTLERIVARSLCAHDHQGQDNWDRGDLVPPVIIN